MSDASSASGSRPGTSDASSARVRSGEGAAEVRLVELVKRFGRAASRRDRGGAGTVLAVDAVTLTVPAGSFFALLGPSGCGKTTTLRMIGGLEQPTGGRILLDDEDITYRKAYKRPVNTVFQNYALFPHLDIFENVAFGLRRRGERDVRGRVEEMLDLVELGGYGRRRPAELSGGQQQRVALARALINHPRVLLLDEPLGALDLKLRRQMQLELRRIQDEVGITFVHVTHDQEEAMTMADAIAVMHAGRVEQLGTPTELYEHPATAFVANFLGQSNLLDAAVVGRDGRAAVVEVAGRRMPLEAGGGRVVGERVLVGVRPEKIRLSLAGGATAATDCRLDGAITDVAFSGVSTQYVVATPGGGEVTVFAQNLARDPGLVPGAAVTLCWDPAHMFAVGAGEGGGGDLRDGAASGAPAAPPPGEPDPPTPGSIAGTVSESGR